VLPGVASASRSAIYMAWTGGFYSAAKYRIAFLLPLTTVSFFHSVYVSFISLFFVVALLEM
jgi:hypothetical protein